MNDTDTAVPHFRSHMAVPHTEFHTASPVIPTGNNQCAKRGVSFIGFEWGVELASVGVEFSLKLKPLVAKSWFSAWQIVFQTQ